jgi:hypothetical protein
MKWLEVSLHRVRRPCGGGVEYLHRSPASRRRQRKEKPSAWGYNWASLFLWDINTGTWPFRLGKSRIWDSKIWSWVTWDSGLRITALARTSSNCKRQTHPLLREDVTQRLWPQVFSKKNCWSWVSRVLSPRRTDWWQTVSRKVTLTLKVYIRKVLRPTSSSKLFPRLSSILQQILSWYPNSTFHWMLHTQPSHVK